MRRDRIQSPQSSSVFPVSCACINLWSWPPGGYLFILADPEPVAKVNRKKKKKSYISGAFNQELLSRCSNSCILETIRAASTSSPDLNLCQVRHPVHRQFPTYVEARNIGRPQGTATVVDIASSGYLLCLYFYSIYLI